MKSLQLKDELKIKEVLKENFTIHTSTTDDGLVLEWFNNKNILYSTIIYIKKSESNYTISLECADCFPNRLDIASKNILEVYTTTLDILSDKEFINSLKVKIENLM